MCEYVVKVACSLVVLLITYIIAPLLALWPRRYWPWCVIWCGQFDDDMDGSLDPGWRTEHIVLPDIGWRKWWNRTRWIWRNPAQYFEYYVLGIPIMANYNEEYEGNINIQDIPVFRPGYLKKTIVNYDGRKIWGYRKVFEWPLIGRCCNMQFGFKVWGSKVGPGRMAKLVFSPISFSKMGEVPVKPPNNGPLIWE